VIEPRRILDRKPRAPQLDVLAELVVQVVERVVAVGWRSLRGQLEDTVNAGAFLGAGIRGRACLLSARRPAESLWKVCRGHDHVECLLARARPHVRGQNDLRQVDPAGLPREAPQPREQARPVCS